MGMGWPQQLDIRVDGRLVKRFTVGGDAPGRPAPVSFAGPAKDGDPEWEVHMTRPDIGLEGVGSSVLATEAIHRMAPICAGDTLDAAVHLKSVYSKTGRSGNMVFVVWAIDFTNQEGESVETIEKSYVYKGGK